MSARLDELERLEKRGTPGPWGWYNGCSWWRLGLANDQSKHAAVIRPTVDRDRQPNLDVSQSDMDLIAALRNAAPALLAIARAAHDVAECLCLPGEPEAYATLGKRLRSALAALDQVEIGGPK